MSPWGLHDGAHAHRDSHALAHARCQNKAESLRMRRQRRAAEIVGGWARSRRRHSNVPIEAGCAMLLLSGTARQETLMKTQEPSAPL